MPVIQVNDRQYSLRPGQNRLGAGVDADVRVAGDEALGVQAIVDVTLDEQPVIRRAGTDAARATVRVNGVPLVDPTPLMHGDKVEIGGEELLYSDDSKTGATQYVSSSEVAELAQKRTGPARATAATGGRLMSLVDGKEYAVSDTGLSIGRDAACTVVVAQNEVSRRHAEVAPVAGGYEVRDLSANGVFVNGERIDRAQILSRADVIRVGSEEFRFYADVPPLHAPASSTAMPAMQPTVAVAAVVRAPAPTAGRLLALFEGAAPGQRYEIRVPLAHIGRGAHNDVVLPDDSVSETHAKIQWRDGGWFLADVGSTNGTFVSGERITAERRLDGPVELRFGTTVLKFRPRPGPADTLEGTRGSGGVDRTTLRDTAAPATLQAAATTPAPKPAGQGIPAWIWGVVALAVVGAAAFFLMNR
jgi:pSer/pThr/pTyr-binding forkhead associated (FHA) protein